MRSPSLHSKLSWYPLVTPLFPIRDSNIRLELQTCQQMGPDLLLAKSLVYVGRCEGLQSTVYVVLFSFLAIHPSSRVESVPTKVDSLSRISFT